MADAFSAAVGSILIAELGISLATKLYQYAKDVRSSPVDIRAIALEIEVTCDVLKQTDGQLGGHTPGGIATASARDSAKRTLEGCWRTFRRIDGFFTSIVKVGVSGAVTIPRNVRLIWPMRSGGLKDLLASLERHKTALLLILAVLSLKQGRMSG
jgi:hypothetical protein